jgi:uncharacterized protein YciI
MFLVLVNYVKPISEIDAHLADHVRFLDAGYAEGLFLASGPQIPRTGGVILARAASRAALEAALAKDPFAVHNLARYDIVEFVPVKTAPELAGLREEPRG